MIYTVTLNPSIDYIMHVDEFNEGDLNRANTTYYYPGGKGINVSRVLKRLDVSNTALGFIGGFTGQFIQNFLESEKVQHQFIDTDQYTRINVKLKSSQESEINGPGPSITEEQQQQLLDQVNKLEQDDYLVVAGSIPKTIPANFYNEMAKRCAERGAHFIADTSGKALEELVGTPTFLLKPNHHELGELFDTTIDSPFKAITFAKQLVTKGATNVIVSMGGDGAILVNKDHAYYANVPKGEVKNSVGAGDSVVSGFIAGYVKTNNLTEAFANGVACGSATAFSDDLATRDFVEELRKEITIEDLN
ncbi:1-phosphofructokinase [Pontibacillus salipaludis]|uniref:Tagatose-6-phosphate kinase n=1 Tax=Pontibacillus salipaludis TaxID=1697394 RepID=A0ABQ1PYT5_9BACI|nr:1-phosphofructokinase [Pontibacillus salipaludis]GGD07309.1 1-phosphofructokinase [Pontibacillus salipaludis]